VDGRAVHQDRDLSIGRAENRRDAEEAAVLEDGRRREHERRQAEHERGRHEQEARLSPDDEDEPADEQPADPRLEPDRAARGEPDGQCHGGDRVGRDPSRRPGDEGP